MRVGHTHLGGAGGRRLGVAMERRGGGDRVARLGSAMDDLETQVDGPGGKGDRRAQARTREKVRVRETR